MIKKIMGAASAGALLMVSLGAAAPLPAVTTAATSMVTFQHTPSEDYYCTGFDNCWPIAHSYEVYSDETMTTLISSGQDSCNGGPFVTAPWLLTGYTVKTRMFVCGASGPFLPFDW